MTWLGNRVSADGLVVKISGDPNPMAAVLRRGNLDTERHPEGEGHVKRETGLGVTLPLAKDCPGLLAVTSSWERGMDHIRPQSPQKQALLTAGFQTASLEN